ncbi:DNA cytosine methyltransferase [Aneurinibacillus migulanus]|uniref:DNA cytosine methyltransferase n=1 Tax=Aneurinibacillus migulanus TaxID=47500 RepID=UPI0006A1DE66|nr:DNA cytosine methyltransferase [Aneurinibacillus migulanus]CEH28283.1 Site-specific DNA methylase [Aneurinibacillus migulanus]
MSNERPIKLVRNIRTSQKEGNTRLFIEPPALEAAGLQVGESIQYTFLEEAIVITRSEDASNIVSRRKRAHWKSPRPLIDRANKEITRILRARERIDILVSDGQLVIRHSRSFDLCVIEKPLLPGNDLKKLRLYSMPAGGGIGTAALIDTGFFESVGMADVWDIAVEAYQYNFKNSIIYHGDVRFQAPTWIPKADVVFLSPPCVEFSLLGGREAGVLEGLGPHFARSIWATGATMVIIEQVPQYFSSRSYVHLKRLLSPNYPYWTERVLDAYDFGSVAGRKRGYAVCTVFNCGFTWPVIPKIPTHKRKTVKQVVGKRWEEKEWFPIEGTAMEKLLQKDGNNNFTAAHNPVLVELESTRISAIVAAYRRYQITSSYLRHPDGDKWRPFSSDELAAFLSVSNWYGFPEWLSEGQRTKLLGQSVDGRVMKAIGIEAAVALMSHRAQASVATSHSQIPMCEVNGQYSLIH